jgi:hypothetical protein
MGAVILKCLRLSRADVRSIPENERHLLVVVGHSANELTILNKQLLWSLRGSTGEGPEHLAQLTQMAFVLRTLAGKVYEVQKTLRRDFVCSGIARQWQEGMPVDLSAAIEKIKVYFENKDNAIRLIRDKYAFHFDEIRVDDALNAVSDEFDLYFGEINGNCLYQGPQIVAMVSLLQAAGGDAIEDTLPRISQEVIDVSRLVLYAANLIIQEVLSRSGYAGESSRVSMAVIEDVPELESVRVPYFVGVDPRGGPV